MEPSDEKKNVKWMPDNDKMLLDQLLAVKESGGMVKNGFQKKAYVAVAKKMDKIHTAGAPKTEPSCQTRAKMV
jgi:hypothetical protein